MKKLILYIFLVTGLLSFTACDLDLENPNAATEADVFTTKDGLTALAVGIQQVYTTTTLGNVIMVPSVTARESAITTTFANLEELEQGATKLSGENGYTSRLFSGLMRSKGMAESLIESIDKVELEAGTAAGLLAWGHLFKAMCLGSLASNYEQVAINNDLNNQALFSDRMLAYQEAVNLLSDAVTLLERTPPSNEFTKTVSDQIDLINTCRALLTRYHVILGNYTDAVSIADQVDLSSKSQFEFDNQNQNPVFLAFFDGVIEYAPRADFGLPASLAPDANDERVSFYIDSDSVGLSLNQLPISPMTAPFYTSNVAPIPVYLPGEVMLNKAEALARADKIMEAEAALNAVRNKKPADDIYMIGANLPDTYSSGGDKSALLNEIYKNRRLEVPFIGTSLEDSRRFDRPQPPTTTDFSSERNRNFYPYPDDERQNNSNTPPNPAI